MSLDFDCGSRTPSWELGISALNGFNSQLSPKANGYYHMEKVMESWEAFEVWANGIWLSIHNACYGREFILHVIIPYIIYMIDYWVSSTFFTIVDMTGKPQAIVQFKIPDPTATKYPRLTKEKLEKVVKQVLFNQTIVAFPVILSVFFLKTFIGFNQSKILPLPHIIVFEFIVQILVEEFFFYYSHRILHHPLFYKRFHKKHHEWTYPVAVSAIYCTPVEHALSNVLPTFLGSAIGRTHVLSYWIWLTFATAYGVLVHSGYHLPLTPTPEFHHYHHSRFNENFGVAGILDWLHGTDKEFRKTKAFDRNKVLWSLTPLK